MTPELKRVLDEASETSTNPIIAAALINYQAAQLVADKLDSINDILGRLNENYWRTQQR